MNSTPTLDAEPVLRALPDDSRRTARSPGPFVRFLFAVLGWAWCLLVAMYFGMTYLSAILVVGWLYRLIQGRVLYGWWKQSRRAREGSFADFCAGEVDAPTLRPRWFLRQQFSARAMRAEMDRPTPDGESPGLLRWLVRGMLAPIRSLWLNATIGFTAVLATFLLLGWGCLLMTFSWEFGWLNSFHKGYEQAFVGPLVGVAGILLSIAAMFYVPMAQIHHAVTGDFRAFFDFRCVWQLIRARLGAYVLLAGVFAFFGLVLEVLKTMPAGFDDHSAYFRNMSDSQLHIYLFNYYLGCSVFLLLALLATRLLAARIYRSAVLKVLRRGRVTREQLHPRLAGWLDRLGLFPTPEPAPQGLAAVVRATGRMGYRWVLYAVLFVIWLGFAAKVYVGEFLNYHPYAGFLNHPLVQVPCVNYIPAALHDAAKQ
jgi:hypothetical protein